MFYGHEILADRKHGVATVWLVATLGSKSSLRRLSRRKIFEVNVPTACKAITNPETPMALRLQSSLLLGVSRVFSQQCGYILTDIQGLHDKMGGLRMTMRDLQIDSSVALTNEQLNLPIDPCFNLDLDMGLDLSAFEISSQSTEPFSLLSPRSGVSSQSSLLLDVQALPYLDLSSDESPTNDNFGNDSRSDTVSNAVTRPQYGHGTEHEEPGIDEYPLFDIGDDGAIVERPVHQAATTSPSEKIPLVDFENYSNIIDQPHDQHVALADIQGMAELQPDDGVFLMGDDDALPPPDSLPTIDLPIGSMVIQHNTASQLAVASDTVNGRPTATAEALQRRVRLRRTIQRDQATELTNTQLSKWQDDYLGVMALARLESATKQSLGQARRNADFWVLDQGIGGVAMNLADDRELHPLSIFSGSALIEALTGTQRSQVGRKRSHSVIESSDDDQDLHRARSGSERNVGRGIGISSPMLDEDGVFIQGDDDDIEPQIGRHPVSSLKDHPSSMPWNAMGSSLQGSAQGSVQAGFSSSVRGTGADVGPFSIFSGRRSRMTSASPLVGRGRSMSRLHSLESGQRHKSFDTNIDDLHGPFAAANELTTEDLELYGPAAVVSTQQAAQNQWVAATLENESYNFLLFLDQQAMANSNDHDNEARIMFEELLPPVQNSEVVAAQAFLHVLTLATKGLIHVAQDEAFGAISLSVDRKDAEDVSSVRETEDIEEA